MHPTPTFAQAAGASGRPNRLASLGGIPSRGLLPLAAGLGLGLTSLAEDFQFQGIDTLVPDGRGSGLANTQSIPDGVVPGPITGLTVSLWLGGVGWSGAFNGDLFVSLQHDSGFAVLLNRPGRSDDNPWGYGDNGFAVTFDDTVGTPDIHTYQVTLGGAPAGALTGTWSADGRTADPAVVTEASPRDAGLDSFLGLEADGNWTLFVADLEPGGQASLQSWRLDITTTQVPEPGSLPFLTALGWLGYALLHRRPVSRAGRG